MFDFSDVNWAPVIIAAILAFLGGDVVGAFITLYWQNRNGAKQPIGKSVSVFSLSPKKFDTPSIETIVTIRDRRGAEGYKDHAYENLYVTNITLVNKGNKDLANFEFGIDFPLDKNSKYQVVYLECEVPTRKHSADFTQVDFTKSTEIIDVNLKPFNRKDQYEFKLLVVAPSNQQAVEPKIITGEPVKFVDVAENVGKFATLPLFIFSAGIVAYIVNLVSAQLVTQSPVAALLGLGIILIAVITALVYLESDSRRR
ncbi:MAG: hypothetical protein EXR62_07885 [Chloroflexi bacterium]|nr:hypothetical protein [Chloroflexota bacterium]